MPSTAARSALRRLLLVVALGGTCVTSVAADPPWQPEKAYKLLWLNGTKKIGESVFRFEEDGSAPGRRRMVLHRQRSDRGHISQTEARLVFEASGRPLTYHEQTEFALASGQRFGARQELRVQFDSGRATVTYINSGDEDNALRNEYEVPADTFLFSTLGLEQWLLFAPRLVTAREARPSDSDGGAESSAGEGPTSRTAEGSSEPRESKPEETRIRVLYTEFGQLIDLAFRAAGDEMLDLGGRPVSARRFDFRSLQWKFEGSIWVDAAGRLVQYRSGPLRLVLSNAP